MFKKAFTALIALAGVKAADLSEHGYDRNSAVKNPDEKLAFVFELVRHGARAPIEDRDLDKFTVGEGILTPEGMRQRYLLGRRNRQRYIDEFGLLSPEYNPNEVYMQSTNVNRTMQSGYSELMGLYPPGAGLRLTPAMIEAVSGVAAPPFKVRDAAAISESLGDEALPQAYVQIPITEFNNNDINDDVSTDGCNFINESGNKLEQDSEYWQKYYWMQEQTQKPLEEALDVTQEYIDSIQVWHDYQMMTDTVVALDFEGYPEHESYFSDEQWETLNEYQKVWLTDDFAAGNSLMMSRMLRKPLALMKTHVESILGRTSIADREEALKFVMYSAHDTQVVNMMNFLAKDIYWTPYASTVIFELKYSASCLEGDNASEDCFGVSVVFNGDPQLFEGCSGDNFTLEGCKYGEFVDYINSKWYDGPSAPDLDQACYTLV